MGKKKKTTKSKFGNAEIWTEEQYEEYLKELYGMKFIAGFTENGVPFGIFSNEDKENERLYISDNDDDELPF